MNKNRSAHLLIGAMNLLVVGSPMLVTQTSKASAPDQQVEKLNAASLKSIEGTWLQVPAACKARGFNASAVSLEKKDVSSDIQNVYTSFEV